MDKISERMVSIKINPRCENDPTHPIVEFLPNHIYCPICMTSFTVGKEVINES